MIKYLLISLLLLSCKPVKVVIIEPIYQPYVDEFERQSVIYNRPIKVDNLIIETVDQLEPKVLGQCFTLGGNWPIPRIQISREKWNEMTEEGDRESLIWHEISHCVLNRFEHDMRIIDGRPRSIMYPTSFDPKIYMKYRDLYIREMFLGY